MRIDSVEFSSLLSLLSLSIIIFFSVISFFFAFLILPLFLISLLEIFIIIIFFYFTYRIQFYCHQIIIIRSFLGGFFTVKICADYTILALCFGFQIFFSSNCFCTKTFFSRDVSDLIPSLFTIFQHFFILDFKGNALVYSVFFETSNHYWECDKLSNSLLVLSPIKYSASVSLLLPQACLSDNNIFSISKLFILLISFLD